jgi:peptidoglycan/LPS O-acetylase OafA/YrhL
MNPPIAYRPDIDGLRAIAVLSVVLYHAGIRSFSGGFVGVDVFFVISGYLITTIIVQDIRSGQFALARFYERRIRRIFPALFTVIPFTLAASAFLFDADAFLAIGKSVVATTLFLSNVLFWSEAGYFDKPSTLKPLLHTWSLAVEEQFYIVFPLLIALIVRVSKSTLKPALILLGSVSLIFSIYNVSHYPSAAFYLAQLRAWELLIGSLLALDTLPTHLDLRVRDALYPTGIVMILASVLFYSNDTPFPGMAAMLPTAGSALAIYSGIDGGTLGGRILSLRPMVFIGRISYSLYLWHWPLIVLVRYYAIRPLSSSDLALLLLGCLTLSALSWKYIETPFRSKGFLKRPMLFGLSGLVMAAVVAAGAIVYWGNGFPNRFDPNEAGGAVDQANEWEHCVYEGAHLAETLAGCALGSPNQAATFLVWGDSHARALAPSINIAAAKRGVAGRIVFQLGCPPLLGIARRHGTSCYEFNNTVLSHIEAHSELTTIILSARWALSANGNRYKTEEGATVKLMDVQSGPRPTDTNEALFAVGLQRTVKKLAELGRKVVIVAQVPEVGYDVPSSNSIALRTGRDLNAIVAATWAEYLARNRVAGAAIDSLRRTYAIHVVDPAKALCDGQRCRVVVDGHPLYHDDDHLSLLGAEYIAYIFDPLFAGLYGSGHGGH